MKIVMKIIFNVVEWNSLVDSLFFTKVIDYLFEPLQQICSSTILECVH